MERSNRVYIALLIIALIFILAGIYKTIIAYRKITPDFEFYTTISLIVSVGIMVCGVILGIIGIKAIITNRKS